jgi:ATP-dependent RNA helicase DHR2
MLPDPVPPGSRKRKRAGTGHNNSANNGLSNVEQPQNRQPVSLQEKRKTLLAFRKQLPIWPKAETIRKGLEKDVLLLVGETGSGKSTQVPQFLLDEPWCKGGCIAVTQPRRVAAISLARRVADEMGTPLGSSSPASKVGYSVRFDQSVSPNTRIKFLTEGMLLQELLRDPSLKQYSAVIVDEVHERSVNVDLILGFLRNLVTDQKKRKGKPLKVVVMSATADVESLSRFFIEGFSKNNLPDAGHRPINGENASEDSWSGISDSEDESTRTAANPKSSGTDEALSGNPSPHISTCYIEGRQFPVKLHYLPAPTHDFVESALKAVFQIHYKEPLPGDILVFMTGQDTVESLERLVNEFAATMGPEVPKVGRTYDRISLAKAK